MATSIPSPLELQLLALVTTERAGRDVARIYREKTGQEVSSGSLYSAFQRLRRQGWVRVRDDRGQDGRIRRYGATPAGQRAVARACIYYASLAAFPAKAAT